ncbi:MAG: MGMT family protein [Desulfobulbaceae bacterium]|nr:MGMT family protein [Desulfobulbaceae bacterium]
MIKDPFSLRAIEIIGRIPVGLVSTYGDIAACAGSPRGARQIARILHSSSKKYSLPWHRVVNREGRISDRNSMSHLDQRVMLEDEGIVFNENGLIDLDRYLWIPVV